MTMALTVTHLEEEYDELKRGIIEHIKYGFSPQESIVHLLKLKEHFADNIKSVRQLDAVESVAELIRLLEKRLLLGWFNVDPFQPILKEYDMEGDSAERYIQYVELVDKYRSRNKKLFSTDPYDPDVLREVPANSEVIPRPIADYICQRIKGKWIEFGKELVTEGVVREGDLDELKDAVDIQVEEKTQRLLDFFVRGDKRNKRSQLCEILKIADNNLGVEVCDLFLQYNPEG